MIIERVVAEDFFSFKKMEVNFTEGGLIQIEGSNQDNCGASSNGSGKTSILEALLFGLFGQTIRYKTDADAVTRLLEDGSRGRCMVRVELSGDKRICIERYRNHRKNKNKLFLGVGDLSIDWDDLEPIAHRKATETQNKICDLLGTDYKTFLHTNLFSVELLSSFASATDSDIKEIMERILGLELLTKAQKLAKDKYKDVKTDISSLESSIVNDQDRIKGHEDMISTLEQKKVEEQENKENKVAELTDRAAERMKARDAEQAKVDELTPKVEAKEQEIKTLQDAKKEELSDLEDQRSKVANKAGSLLSTHDSLVRQINKLNKSISTIEQTVGKPCVTCGREVTDKEITALTSGQQNELAEASDELAEAKVELDKVEKLRDSLTEQKREITQKYKNIGELEIELDNLDTEVHKHNTEIKALDRELDGLAERLAELDAEEGQFDELIQQEQTKIDAIKDSLKNQDGELADLTHQMTLYDFWVEGFGNTGMKSLIIEDTIPLLTKSANEYCDKMADGAFDIEFSAQSATKKGEVREKFSVSVNNRFGAGSYVGGSTGEKRRVDLAILHALQMVSHTRSIQQTFFDEVMVTLDPEGGQRFLTLLKEDIASGLLHSAYIITNNPDNKGVFDKVLHVQKKLGVSSIVDPS